MKRFTYPIRIERAAYYGCPALYVAVCPDVCEAIALGVTVEQAIAEVTRELEFAITKRIVYGQEIPLQRGYSTDHTATVPDSLARLASQYLKAHKGQRLRKKSFLSSEYVERIETLVAQRVIRVSIARAADRKLDS